MINFKISCKLFVYWFILVSVWVEVKFGFVVGLWFKFEGIGLGVYREIKDIDEVCVLKDCGEVVVYSFVRVNGGLVVCFIWYYFFFCRIENRVSENRISGNIVSGNRISENRISGNRINRISDDSLIKEVILLLVNIFKSNNDFF